MTGDIPPADVEDARRGVERLAIAWRLLRNENRDLKEENQKLRKELELLRNDVLTGSP